MHTQKILRSFLESARFMGIAPQKFNYYVNQGLLHNTKLRNKKLINTLIIYGF